MPHGYLNPGLAVCGSDGGGRRLIIEVMRVLQRPPGPTSR